MCESFLFLWFLRFIEHKRILSSSIANAMSDNDKQNLVFDSKASSSSFTIFRHLQQILLDVLSRLSDTFSHYLLVAAFVSLFTS